jgi:DNA-binding CsgD family transcriptional regulator
LPGRAGQGVSGDAISIVEAAYDLESDTRTWLSRVLERAAPQLDRGFGVIGAMVDPPPPGGSFVSLSVRLDVSDEVLAACFAIERAAPEFGPHAYRPPAPLTTGSANIGLTEKEAAIFPPYVKLMHPLGIRDCLAASAVDPGGHTVALCAPMSDLRRPSRVEVARWGRIMAHVTAGSRLRRLGAGSPGARANGVDAVLSPSGEVKHAEPDAQGSTARESLRAAAKAIDRARSRSRRDDEEALELWRGLVAGRWSLVDQFDSDGRRLLVARRNDPQVSDPRALTLRERQVLAYVAMGHPLKLVAYTLGLSLGTVSLQRARGMRKLGLRTQAGLVQLFAGVSGGPPARPPPQRRTRP